MRKKSFGIRSLVILIALLVFASSVHAEPLRVGIGFALPPYVIRETNSGMEVDIVREAFRRAGFEVEFLYLPNLRLPLAYSAGVVDCVVANKAYDLAGDSGKQTYPSAVTVSYQNYAISMERAGFSIDSINDLAGKRVLGFNNAVKYLGPEFEEMARKNGEYTELADQALQVRMLFSGRVQVVISDKRIFLWWRDRLMEKPVAETLDLFAPLVFHQIFPPAPRRIYCPNAPMRDKINTALTSMRADNTFDTIIDEYLLFQP